jgi:hypothetical protein
MALTVPSPSDKVPNFSFLHTQSSLLNPKLVQNETKDSEQKSELFSKPDTLVSPGAPAPTDLPD